VVAGPSAAGRSGKPGAAGSGTPRTVGNRRAAQAITRYEPVDERDGALIVGRRVDALSRCDRLADGPLTPGQVTRLRTLADEPGLDQHPDWPTLLRAMPGDPTASHRELVNWLTAPEAMVDHQWPASALACGRCQPLANGRANGQARESVPLPR